MQKRFIWRGLCGIAAAVIVAGCTPHGEPLESAALVIPPPSDQRPQDEPVLLGKVHYAAGDYGLAERYFRAAVESNSKSNEAWLGLAASYDRLARYDLAERAYRHLLSVQGRTPEVLNNLGYHHLLRGNLAQARSYLMEAERKDPGNPMIQGNLHLLATWKNGEPT